MAKRKRKPTEIEDYRHDATRKNIPPAGLAAHGRVREVPKTRYSYDPHLPPVLRFDETGEDDRLPELLAEAQQRPLTDDEARLLAEALRNRQPWLEWAGKREKRWFDVTPWRCTSTSAFLPRPSSNWPNASPSSARCLPTRSWSTARRCNSTSTTWTGPTG